jgi:hypothetical protein
VSSRFQLYWHQQQLVAGAMFMHARLKVLRPSGRTTVGVFQLTLDEWNELVECCNRLGIEVTRDREEPLQPISKDAI